MSNADSDKIFAGSIPKLNDEYLVPLIFEPYAEDLASRLAARPLSRVLEIAAGTGVVTRQLAAVLPSESNLTASIPLRRDAYWPSGERVTAADLQHTARDNRSFTARVSSVGMVAITSVAVTEAR